MGGLQSKKEKKGLELSFSKPFIKHVEWSSSFKHAKNFFLFYKGGHLNKFQTIFFSYFVSLPKEIKFLYCIKPRANTTSKSDWGLYLPKNAVNATRRFDFFQKRYFFAKKNLLLSSVYKEGIIWTFARIPLAMSGAIRRLHYIKMMKKLFSITFLSASVQQSSNYENSYLRLYAVVSSHLLTSCKKGKLQLTLTRMLSCFLPIPTHPQE